MPTAHEALDREHSAPWVRDGLPTGGLADEDVAFIGERDDARREPVAFGVRNNFRLFTFHHGDDRVGGTQVDADDFFPCSHDRCSFETSVECGFIVYVLRSILLILTPGNAGPLRCHLTRSVERAAEIESDVPM